MKLSPFAQKQADDWLDNGGILPDLAEILGINRGKQGAYSSGHCYQAINDNDFSAHAIEEMVDDERYRQLKSGDAPTEGEIGLWRQAARDAQEATRFFVWDVHFSRERLFVLSVHRKSGFIDRMDGPFHSVEAALPYGDIVYDQC